MAAVPLKKLPSAPVAAATADEDAPLLPWFNVEATAAWTTRSMAVPEAEQSAMVAYNYYVAEASMLWWLWIVEVR